MASYKFRKSERLTNKNRFEELFASGNTLKAFPLKIVYHLCEPDSHFPPLQMAFSVPKRNFKSAAKRNQIKRKLREAYRLHKHKLSDNLLPSGKQLYGIIIYVDRNIRTYKDIEASLQYAIRKLKKEIQSH
jgi:ribonuclease P protein component